MSEERRQRVRRGTPVRAFVCSLVFFLPLAGLYQEHGALSLSAVDDLANPVLSSRADWEKAVLNYDSLALRLAKRSLPSERGKPADVEADQPTALVQSLIIRFLDFSLQMPGREERDLVFSEPAFILNLPTALAADIRESVAGIARRSYDRMSSIWHEKTGLPVPPGLLFIKIFASPQEMNRLYGLEDEVMGVAFPCRYIAAALRLDQAGNLVRPELENVLSHEICHVFCYTALGFSRIGRLPLWFHEGVAMELSGQTQVHHVVQDSSGTFILTLTSPDDYVRYHRVFRFLREKFGPEMMGAFISKSLITAELGGDEQKSLLLESEAWFRARRNLEWLIVLLTAAASVLVYFLAKSKKSLSSAVVALTGILVLSLTPYYAHSRLRYGIGAVLAALLFYQLYKRLRASFVAAGLLREVQRFENAGDDVRALSALKGFLLVDRNDRVQRWLDRRRVERARQRQLEIERRIVERYTKEAARFEEQLDFEGALDRYQLIYDNVTGLLNERDDARQNLERVKGMAQLFSLLSQESDKRPTS